MGLLKRLFSIGSKKKKQHPPIVHNVPLPEPTWTPMPATNEEDEHEAAVGRLLRSSSARFVEHSGLDYATLPPLPHPINKVIQTPASSCVSLETTSLSQRGTYNVTVHKRKRHGSTEFPNANSDLGEKPKHREHRTSLQPVEDSRVLKLRSDPSVASLIDLYDEHGKLSNDVFSNSPPSSPKVAKEGRAQVARSGSTLRQLLGAPSSSSGDGDESGSAEGDISWAERFLAETECTVSTSTLDLPTPTTPHQTPGHLREPEISFVTEGSIANTTFDNPAISSMEVELSMDTSADMDDLYTNNNPYGNSAPNTPQRASQVFGFLTQKRLSKAFDDLDRTLPELPSCFSSPTNENVEDNSFSRPTKDLLKFQVNPARIPATPIPRFDDTHRNSRPQSTAIGNSQFAWESNEPASAFSDDSHDPHYVPKNSIQAQKKAMPAVSTTEHEEKHNAIKVIMNGPTKVIVTAPTPSTNHDGPSRLPRGPRALPRRTSSSRRRPALVEVSNSSSTAADPPNSHHKGQARKRRASQSSHSSEASYEHHTQYTSRSKKSEPPFGSKENQLALSLSAKPELPSTPIRSNISGSRSLLRTVVEQSIFRPPVDTVPSPASSSEMSPVGRQIMMDVRQQRMRAREADRARFGFGLERNASNRI
ncbi:hypothetical protein CPB84DRAFT_1704963 [Gymnopilus junonius]|uniref:Uncharacterized protein n=1 Tax=Gymnopilus junonius TaxID=109634 RepID=A0A9P5NTW0_GYMJU|nr:hypothetical protein CPB84DRAFT_1704963 [Gymnopilus junonius]